MTLNTKETNMSNLKQVKPTDTYLQKVSEMIANKEFSMKTLILVEENKSSTKENK